MTPADTYFDIYSEVLRRHTITVVAVEKHELEVVNLTGTSWNRLVGWLREVDLSGPGPGGG